MVNNMHTHDLSLLYDFAITHEVFSNLEKDAHFHLVINLLKRMHENGLVANLGDGEWLREFYEICSKEQLNQHRVNKILMLLIKLKDSNRLYLRAPLKTEVESWTSCIEKAHNQNPFYAIVTTCGTSDYAERLQDFLIDLCPENNSFDLLERIEGKRNVRLTKTTEDFRQALRPLLQYASSAMIIDPYANCTNRYINSIKIFLDLLGSKRSYSTSCSLEIHAGNPEEKKLGEVQPKERLAMWKNTLQPLVNASGHIVQIFLRKLSLGEKKFHNRFIITEQCGIQVPYGADCFEGKGPDDQWTLLDRDVSDTIQFDYSKNQKFELLHRPLILTPEL